MLTFGQILVRLIIGTILSGLIGLERESKHKPAGLRTNMLVGLSATLAMIIPSYLNTLTTTDITHVIAGMVTGIGFLGAGSIIRDQGEVHGITTAATILVVAIVGLASGLGYFSAAIITTLIVLIILYFLANDKIKSGINHNGSETEKEKKI